MAFINKLQKLCTSLGENNKPTYVVMAIATVKGICRPMFTMMDKTENPETKKYTAIREGLTEIIAIPVYWACGEMAGKLSGVFAKPQNFMDKNMFKKYKAGDESSNVRAAYKQASDLAANNLPKLQKNLMFVGVCTAALLVIPALCSVAIKPLMGVIQKDNKDKKKLDINTQSEFKLPKAPFKSNDKYQHLSSFATLYQATQPSGMKVGGV